jgi:hypothetical protein
MFQLTEEEAVRLRSQIVTLKSGRDQHRKYAPYVFTEQGVAMLSSVLKSERAVHVNIEIMRAFVRLGVFWPRTKSWAASSPNSNANTTPSSRRSLTPSGNSWPRRRRRDDPSASGSRRVGRPTGPRDKVVGAESEMRNGGLTLRSPESGMLELREVARGKVSGNFAIEMPIWHLKERGLSGRDTGSHGEQGGDDEGVARADPGEISMVSPEFHSRPAGRQPIRQEY